MNLPAFRLDHPGDRRESTDFEILSNGRTILRKEIAELQRVYENIPVEFASAVRMISQCAGSVIVTGIGKAGWIGQKLSASFASTGTRSHFLHAAEAVHGDLGRIDSSDLVLVLSNSGETEEIVRLLPALKKSGAQLIALTGKQNSSLAKNSDCVLAYGTVNEACSNNLAPSVSTTIMLALGDALALTVSEISRFTALDFARFHPGGSLGRKLQTVDEAMRPLSRCRTTSSETCVREAIARQSREGRRTGALLVINDRQHLLGIFTDSDLVRLLEKKQDSCLDSAIGTLMTANPRSIESGRLVSEAIELLSSYCISELPVVNQNQQVVGLIDITDVIS